tara:strand:+ start:1073 stop:1600 length:528 start_codon:yes stop_codon:yes gene_type:complete
MDTSSEGNKFLLRTDLTDAENREIAAYHEAGHAVSAWILEFGIGEVAIRRKGGGHTCIGTTLDELRSRIEELQLQRRSAIHSLAGICAEKQFRPDVLPDGGIDDLARVNRAIDKIVRLSDVGDYDETRTEIQEATRQLVNQHWARISALAGELLVTPILAGPDAVRIIKSADAPM